MTGLARFIRRQLLSLSGVGLMLGALFFAAALTPTLIPRSYLTQGALAGGCFAIGYLAGELWRRLWHYLELPEPSARARSVANALVAVGCLLVVIISLWRTTAWQNAIRSCHEDGAGRDRASAQGLRHRADHVRRAAGAGAAVCACRPLPRCAHAARHSAKGRQCHRRAGRSLLFWSIASNVLIRTAFNALDSSFRELDVLFEPERPQPTDAARTGSAASLVKWKELGRMGRRFIASGPTAAEISAVTERPAQEPVRVYVGLAARDTAQARARLALDELKRQHGFERKILIVITPTGTGWIDPAAMDTVEYLHHGDVASVAMQYSYLNSPLSLLFQPEYGAEAARALFAEIYGYWTTLPKDKRPKLYLHGLSLGALNSEKSAELFETIGDPIAGALWSGAPFASRIWRSITDNRNPGSPAWLPEFRDGRFVRFMNQNGPTVPPDTPWGPMRVVYLQYASDAITFFAYRDAFRAPAWMNAPRGPDVSPELRWYPIVTMLQLALDMAVATGTPMGFGHVYAPEHYVDAWVAVTDVSDWSAEALAKLKSHLAARARKTSAGSLDDDPDRGG